MNIGGKVTFDNLS